MSAGTAAGVAGLALLQSSTATEICKAADDQSQLAMLVDVSKCVGCWYCYAACKKYNGLPETKKPDPEQPPPLAPATWTTLFTKKRADDTWQSRKQACMHCTDAACVEVCPTGALSKNNLGFVEFDRDKCSGCGYCAKACPFEVPQLERDKITGDAQMDKCTFCSQRIEEAVKQAKQDHPDDWRSKVGRGETIVTSCADACPTGAITFGWRSELLTEGKERAEELQQTMPDAQFYGDGDIAGGLHVMYVLEGEPEETGLPAEAKVPASATAHDILQWAGIGAAAAVLAGFGLNYLVARARMNREKD